MIAKHQYLIDMISNMRAALDTAERQIRDNNDEDSPLFEKVVPEILGRAHNALITIVRL